MNATHLAGVIQAHIYKLSDPCIFFIDLQFHGRPLGPLDSGAQRSISFDDDGHIRYHVRRAQPGWWPYEDQAVQHILAKHVMHPLDILKHGMRSNGTPVAETAHRIVQAYECYDSPAAAAGDIAGDMGRAHTDVLYRPADGPSSCTAQMTELCACQQLVGWDFKDQVSEHQLLHRREGGTVLTLFWNRVAYAVYTSVLCF